MSDTGPTLLSLQTESERVLFDLPPLKAGESFLIKKKKPLIVNHL